MTDTPAEPDWSLLRSDPVRFFGLSAGFDRRNLKRSYNQLLRRFKPEHFPQEFQQIRAAYEWLENAIRYGQSTDSGPPPAESFEWLQDATPPVAQPVSTAPTSRSPALPLHERIQSGSVSEIYQELKDRPNKSPYDFYSLAVMSDAVDRQQGQQFIYWILQGLTAHPNEIGLWRLLHAYCSGPVESEHCEQLLVACSKIVGEDQFFPLTDPLWRLMLRTRDFSEFRTALRKCEANLKGINIDNRLAFYLQILKPAVWVADAEWFREAYNLIEQNFDRIPSFLDYDLEILSRLRAYIDVRESLVERNEILQRLDGAMRDYFSEDQLTGDQSVLACQVLIAQNSDGLATAFADFGDPAYAILYAVWVWVSYDVGERHVEPPKEVLNEDIWHPRTKTLLSQIDNQTVRSRLGIKWASRRVLHRSAQAAALFFCATLLSVVGAGITGILLSSRNTPSGEEGMMTFAVVAGVTGGVLAGIAVAKRITKRYWEPFSRRIAADCYRQLWQREIVNFLARSHLPLRTLRAYIHSFPSTTTSAAWVKHYIDLDYSLPMFAIAHSFVV